MATKKRKEDDEAGLDKKRRKSGVAANGAELHEEQQPIVSFRGCIAQHKCIMYDHPNLTCEQGQ